MALDLEDLLARLRIDLSDPELPGAEDDPDNPDSDSLWSTADLIDGLDQAQKEYAEETLAFFDSTSYTPTVTAGNPLVALDERIIDIRFGELSTAQSRVVPRTMADIEREYGITWTSQTGSPKYLVTDYAVGYGRLYPAPVEDDTLTLYVYRYPLTDLECIHDSLEVRTDQHKRGLLLRAMELAYSNYDAESRDDNRASEYADRWQRFLDQAKSRIRKNTRRPRTVRFNEF